MNISFIGAGKVGIAWGTYLANNGFPIVGYYSRSNKSAEYAAIRTNSKSYKNLKNLLEASDIIFITTNDDQIAKVGQDIANHGNCTTNKILIHMSGALTSEVLISTKNKGYYTYSLHPLQAFADIDKAIKDLEKTVFSIKGDKEKINVIEKILKKTGNHYFELTPEQKKIYHAVNL